MARVETLKCGCIVDNGPDTGDPSKFWDKPLYLRKCRDHRTLFSCSGKPKQKDIKQYTIEEEINMEYGADSNGK